MEEAAQRGFYPPSGAEAAELWLHHEPWGCSPRERGEGGHGEWGVRVVGRAAVGRRVRTAVGMRARVVVVVGMR